MDRQDNILYRVIIGDEIWVYQYDPKTKRQTAQWKTANSPRPKKNPSVQIKSQNNVDFFILEGLFIMNLYQLDKQSTQFTIWKYWKGCVKKLDGNDPNILPPTHGPCIMTMHLFTRHCLWGRFLLLNK